STSSKICATSASPDAKNASRSAADICSRRKRSSVRTAKYGCVSPRVFQSRVARSFTVILKGCEEIGGFYEATTAWLATSGTEPCQSTDKVSVPHQLFHISRIRLVRQGRC